MYVFDFLQIIVKYKMLLDDLFFGLFGTLFNLHGLVFPLPSLLTLLPMILKDLGLVCCLLEIPRFYGRHVAQCQAPGSRQGI